LIESTKISSPLGIESSFGKRFCSFNNLLYFQTASDPYAFVEFADHHSATQALQAMNNRMLLDKQMKVNWAVQVGIFKR
jgi:RNA recognition motif-containing protein